MLTFILNFLYFWFAVLIAFYIPGSLILSRFKFTKFQKIVLGSVLGMVLWGWQGLLFGNLNVRWLSYVYLILTTVVWLKETLVKREKINVNFRAKKIDLLIIGIFCVGVVIQLSSVIFTGLLNKEGLYFCCGNISDNLFHIALTKQIILQIPPFEPGAYGVIVHNYHYLSNLVTGELIRVFNLPLIETQFQGFTVFISLLLGLTAIVFSQILNLEKKFTAWLLFFLYFSGDLLYLILLILNKGLSFKMGSLENSAIFLDNLPRAFSIVVFLAGLSLFVVWIKKKDLFTGIVLAIMLGSLIAFKVYTGIFILSGLLAVSIYFILLRKLFLLFPILITFLLSLILYLPVNSGAGGLYFIAFGLFENFIVNPNFGLVRMQLALTIYRDHSNFFRVAEYETIFFLLYVFGTFGTKLIGLFQTKKSLSLFPKELNILLIFGIFVSSVAGFFFQQTSGGANTFNFLVSVFIIGSLYCALSCYYLSGRLRKPFNYVFIFLVIIITIPHIIFQFADNIKLLRGHEGFLITNNEIKGFDLINSKTKVDSLYLATPEGFSINTDSPYLSFMLKGKSYLSGEGILRSHGVDISERKKYSNTIFTDTNEISVAKSVLVTKIDWLLLKPEETLKATRSAAFIHNVFENKDIKILEINRPEATEYIKNHPLGYAN